MIVRHQEFVRLSQRNQFKLVRTVAPRGRILDRNGFALVENRWDLSLSIRKYFCRGCETVVLPTLARVLGWSDKRLREVTQKVRHVRGWQRYQALSIAPHIHRDAMDILLGNKYRFPGIEMSPKQARKYTIAPGLAQVIGYVGPPATISLENVGGLEGKQGIERYYNDVLSGQDGFVRYIVNSRGNILKDERGYKVVETQQPSIPGDDLVLSVDMRLQRYVEKIFPAQAGVVILLEVQTGFIQALVSRPSFDPNAFSNGLSNAQFQKLRSDPFKPLLFRPTAAQYPPGSVFKVVTTLAALNSGLVDGHTSYFCGGTFSFGNRTWRCHSRRGHGNVQLVRAFQQSCDTYFYHLGQLVGINRIAGIAKLLGFGNATNFRVAPEVNGVIPDRRYHQRFSKGGYARGMDLNSSIGQGAVSVTPMQLALAYAAIVNGGKLLRPQIVQSIRSQKSERKIEPEVQSEFFMEDSHRRLLFQSLSSVVNKPGGTAYRYRPRTFVAGGKTGTAQVVKLEKDRPLGPIPYARRDHAWFVGVAPMERPEIVAVVLHEHGGNGGSQAAPTALRAIQKYMTLRSLGPRRTAFPE